MKISKIFWAVFFMSLPFTIIYSPITNDTDNVIVSALHDLNSWNWVIFTTIMGGLSAIISKLETIIENL